MELAYHTLKTIHIVAVIAWMAGMLYLPRLYVYHASATAGSDTSETFKTMERRLLRAIINPVMIVTWLTGLSLAHVLNAFDPANGSWLHAKLTLVLGLQAIHVLLARHRRAFAEDRNTKSAFYFKVLNETVTVLMVGIVALVVFKPF